MASPPNPADIKYGGFYLPIFSLLYVYQEIGLPVELPLYFLNIVLTDSNFPIFAGLTFLGALIGHGASKSIYSTDGAKHNPKNRWVVLWYRTLFTVKKNPGKPPRTIDELEKKMITSVEWFWNLSRVEKTLISVYRLGRFTVIWPAKLVFLSVALLTTWVLANVAISGSLQALGALFLVTQIVFFFGSWVFNRFPTSVPLDAAPWLYLAEYHKAEYLHDRGDVDFEYGPLNFTQSAVDRFDEAQRRVYDRPSYYDNGDVDWMVSLENTPPQYVVPLDEDTESERNE